MYLFISHTSHPTVILMLCITYSSRVDPSATIYGLILTPNSQ